VLVAKGRQRIGCLRRTAQGAVPVPVPAYFERALAPYRNEPRVATIVELATP
jgi:hypothetical protein